MYQKKTNTDEPVNIIYLEDVNSISKNMSGEVRGDYYKIVLIAGDENKLLPETQSSLLFLTPGHFYTNEYLAGIKKGFLCTFSTSFFNDSINNTLNALPMYKSGNAYSISKRQAQHIGEIFNRILAELASDYLYKYDLIRNYIFEITHYVLKYLN